MGGEIVGWTQNGQVLNQSGKHIGVYERLVEFGGQSREEQVMIIYR